MTRQAQTTVFTKKGCVACERAKATLRDAGTLLFRSRDVEAEQRNTDAAVYFSGKVTVPQVFIGDYPIGGADDLEELWRTRRLRDIANAMNATATLDIDSLSDAALVSGAEDTTFTRHIPASDGTRSDDPEQWPILHFYKDFFGFWPNTFVYLHRWPEAYKRFVYCQNMAAVGSAKESLGIELLSAVAYATSNAHGCNYCQVHSVATMGDASMDAVEQLRLARVGQRDADNPFDEYRVSLADLAGMASLNEVPAQYLERVHRLAAAAQHAPADVNAHIMAVALVSASFGFLNVFNDLVGMEIEGGWATAAQSRLGVDAGRHGVNGDHNPNNLSHELPSGGPTAQQLMGKYTAEIGDVGAYAGQHFGIVPPWMHGFPARLRPLHAALYGTMMQQRLPSVLTAELKHILVYVAHVEKRHAALAATEAFIAHHVSEDRPATIQRVQHAFAVASGRGGNAELFTDAERAALRLAYLSAQTPLITPRRFVQPVIDHFDTDTCVELFVVCSIASLVQRFAAIITPPHSEAINSFMAEHDLPTDALAMRFPLP